MLLFIKHFSSKSCKKIIPKRTCMQSIEFGRTPFQDSGKMLNKSFTTQLSRTLWVHKSFSLKEFRGDTNLGSLPCGVSSRSEKLLCTLHYCYY